MSAPHVLVVSAGFGYQNRGSFLQTLHGLSRGLEQNGITVSHWEASSLDELEGALPSIRGVTAVLLIGPPTGQQWMRMLIHTAETAQVPVFWMLAANSLTLPSGVLGFLKAYPWIEVITPSDWSAQVIHTLLSSGPLYAWATERQRHPLVVPHGVEIAPGLAPPVTEEGLAHAVAGTTGRKGTEELIEAMRLFGSVEHLVVYADATAFLWAQGLAEGVPNVRVVRAYNGDATPGFWRHRVFVQPSRAEGFGLCAVEAWLLGRTVIMRRSTGEPALPGALLLPEDERFGEPWEGGDGPVTHDTAGLVGLRRLFPEILASGVYASLCQGGARSIPSAAEAERFRYGVAIEPFVRVVRDRS